MARAFKMGDKVYSTITSMAKELGLKRLYVKDFPKYGIAELTVAKTAETPAAETVKTPVVETSVVETAETTSYKVMTVVVDEDSYYIDQRCTYADDAIGMEAGSTKWDKFFGHYPCLLQNGVELCHLNPSDYTRNSKGSAVDITNGTLGDVMVAFPRRGLKVTKENGKYIISMTDNPNAPGFEYMAHRRGDTLKDKFYLGAYQACEQDSKLRSLSGAFPVFNKTVSQFRVLAQAHGASDGDGGSGYDQFGFFQLLYLQCMFLLKYKSLDSLGIIGNGVDFVYNNKICPVVTGSANKLGLDTSAQSHVSGTTCCKLFGIEDIWGNLHEWIDGIVSVSSSQKFVLTATQKFNDSGDGYKTRDINQLIQLKNAAIWSSQHIRHFQFSKPDLTFVGRFGGYRNQSTGAGMFSLTVMEIPEYAFSGIGGRLMYL